MNLIKRQISFVFIPLSLVSSSANAWSFWGLFFDPPISDITITYTLRDARLEQKFQRGILKELSVDIANNSVLDVSQVELKCSFYDSDVNRIDKDVKIQVNGISSIAPGKTGTWEWAIRELKYKDAKFAECHLVDAR